MSDVTNDAPKESTAAADRQPAEPGASTGLRRALAAVFSVTLGWAIVVCLAAIGLATYSQTGASRTNYNSVQYLPESPSGTWDFSAPGRIATATLIAAIAIALLALAACWHGTVAAWLPLVLGSIAVIIYATTWAWGTVLFTHRVQGAFLRSEQWPTAVAGWVLAVSAAVGVIIGAILRGGRTRPARRPVIAGAALGLVAALAVTGAAWRAGDDSQFVDSTAAAATPVPAVPDMLGQQRFHLKVADDTYVRTDGTYPVRVLAGGAGFFALHAGTLTAYDRDGKERWHYRRTAPELAVHWFEVFGDTVIVKLAGSSDYAALVAMDAVTGRPLWHSDNAALTSDTIRTDNGISRPTWHLVTMSRDSHSVPIFDPATGAQTHTVTLPEHCSSHLLADTRTRVVVVAGCTLTPDTEAVRVLTINPQTGQTVADQHLLDLTADSRPVLSAQPAGADGLQLQGWHDGGPPAPVFFNAATTRMVSLPPDTYDGRIPSSDSAGDFLVDLDDPHAQYKPAIAAALYGSDGTQRCVLADHTVVMSGDTSRGHAGPVWLRKQILLLHDPGLAKSAEPDQLRLINRADCTVAATLPNTNKHKVFAMTAAPGVTVVASMDATGTYLDGYH